MTLLFIPFQGLRRELSSVQSSNLLSSSGNVGTLEKYGDSFQKRAAKPQFAGKTTISHRNETIQVKAKEITEPSTEQKLYHLYVNDENVGSLTVVKKQKSQNLYQGKPYLWISYLDVEARYNGKGYSKLLVQMAVELSKKMDCEGRTALNTWAFSELPTGLIHAKNGFRYY